MAQNTFPAFTNMIPTVEDMQLVVDSLRQQDRYQITKDGIFTSGIVNHKDAYLSAGTNENSLKIKPFIAYTANGNRIEVSDTWDNLYAQGDVINVTNANLVSNYENIPVWYSFINNFSNLSEQSSSQSLKLTSLGRGSILHGIKVRVNSLFSIVGAETQPNVYISIGTSTEPEKFLPQTCVSNDSSSTNLSVMNLMYSIDDENTTDIVITYTSDLADITTLTNGALTVNLCIANLSGFDNSDLTITEGGYQLNNTAVGTWLPNTTYHIVVRYEETPSNYRQLNYTTIDGTVITTTSEPTRFTTNYGFYALRKTGTVIDYTTLDDVKLGEIVTDINGNIYTININGKNANGDNYTDYLTIPGYRFVENIDASQIAGGKVTNTQFDFLSNVTSDIQTQLNAKASIATNNIFTGDNTFESQIKGSIDKVNGFTAYATPVANSLLVLDNNGKVPADAISESTFSSIGNFYTISSGPTTNGRSSYLTPLENFNGVTVNASNSQPLVLNYPNGAVEKLTSNQNVTGLSASGYYYLLKEQNGNFIFLPTSGGTLAIIPVVGSGNNFTYYDGTGTVSSSYDTPSAYKAFDGNTNTYASMGKVTYQNYNEVETIGYLPNGETYIDINFSNAVTTTGFAACFRKNQYDITPKAWNFMGSNDNGATWTTLATASTDTWNIDEIKTIVIAGASSYTKFRFTFNLTDTTVNNYMLGEETDEDGVTMPVNCYYFQVYATNTDTSIKGNVIEGYIQPTNMSIGSYFLDLSKKPYTGYKCIGNNQFTPVNFVKMGFIDLVDYGGTNPSLTCYPFSYNTFTYSDNKTTYHINNSEKELKETIAVNDTLYFDHNLGIIPNIVKVKYQCVTANNGYSVGDYIETMYASDTVGLTSINDSISVTITTVTLHPGSVGSTLYIKHKSTGALSSTSNGHWKAIIYCSRGW